MCCCWFWFVTVCGLAVVIRRAHIYKTAVLARPAAVWGDTTAPALAITGGASIHVLQGFVFDVGIGVGRKGPDSADLLVHLLIVTSKARTFVPLHLKVPSGRSSTS